MVLGSDRNPVTFHKKQISESCLTCYPGYLWGCKLSEFESCPHYVLVVGHTSGCDVRPHSCQYRGTLIRKAYLKAVRYMAIIRLVACESTWELVFNSISVASRVTHELVPNTTRGVMYVEFARV